MMRCNSDTDISELERSLPWGSRHRRKLFYSSSVVPSVHIIPRASNPLRSMVRLSIPAHPTEVSNHLSPTRRIGQLSVIPVCRDWCIQTRRELCRWCRRAEGCCAQGLRAEPLVTWPRALHHGGGYHERVCCVQARQRRYVLPRFLTMPTPTS